VKAASDMVGARAEASAPKNTRPRPCSARMASTTEAIRRTSTEVWGTRLNAIDAKENVPIAATISSDQRAVDRRSGGGFGTGEPPGQSEDHHGRTMLTAKARQTSLACRRLAGGRKIEQNATAPIATGPAHGARHVSAAAWIGQCAVGDEIARRNFSITTG